MLVVVGGHSRNIGKTSVAAGLIRHLRDRRWTALKITQYGHGVCSHHGVACGCETEPDHPFALSEEYEPSRTDSGRFLAAGAERSFWLRTPAGQLRGAADQVRKILAQHENVMVESNSLLELADPDLFLMVMDFAQADFKESSARFLGRADAIVVVDRGIDAAQPGATPVWKNVAHGLWEGKPQFPVKPPDYVTRPMVEFVRSRASYASANTGA
ncbi:MAG: hypothetical protein ABSG03_06580 [Bryobacteraceae bacterium]|jgi:hypothetical protein